jgi:TorA maturation chaperone TorD
MSAERSGPSPYEADDLARECLYRFLASVVSGPVSHGWDRALTEPNLALATAAAVWLLSGDDPGSRESGSGDEGFDRLAEELRAPREALRTEYDRVFGLVVPRECPPYETEYYPTEETFGRSQQMADAAGFYRAFGIEPSRSAPERPDHIALELEFMAFLLTKKRLASEGAEAVPEGDGRADLCDRTQRDFFRDHLAWWVPAFAAGLRRRARGGYLGALAGVLAAWVPAECRRLDIPAVLRPARSHLIEPPAEQSGCAACPLLA